MAVEWIFIGLNLIAVAASGYLLLKVMRKHSETKHKTSFWIFFAAMTSMFLLLGIMNIAYEMYGFTLLENEKINLPLMIIALLWIFFHIVYFGNINLTKLFVKPMRKMKSVSEQAIKNADEEDEEIKDFDQSGSVVLSSSEISKSSENNIEDDLKRLNGEMKIIEDAYKYKIIDKETYEKDKADIIAIKLKLGKKVKAAEAIQGMDKLFSKIDEEEN